MTYQLSEVQATQDSRGAFEGVGFNILNEHGAPDRHLRLSRSNERGKSARADREGDCGRSADYWCGTMIGTAQCPLTGWRIILVDATILWRR